MDKPEREGLEQPGTEANVAKAARAHLAAGGGGLFLGNILIALHDELSLQTLLISPSSQSREEELSLQTLLINPSSQFREACSRETLSCCGLPS